jgi:sugar lactone lactonase YvrE
MRAFDHTIVRDALVAAGVICTCAFLASDARAHPAWGIVVDRKGLVYFSDLETIWRVSPDGQLAIVRGGVSGRHVHELAIDAADNLRGQDFEYLPERQQYRQAIWEMAPSGKVVWIVPPTEHLPPGSSLWADASGTMYSIEQDAHARKETVILKRGPDGQVKRLAGGGYGHRDGTGAEARFTNVVGTFLGPDAALYFTDGATIRRVSFGGVVTTLVEDVDAVPPLPENDRLEFGQLMGLAVTASHDVFVADFRNRRVVKIDAHGRKQVVLVATPPWSPTGVAVGRDGVVYVLEVGFAPPGTWLKPRVRRILRDGKVTVLTSLPN